ncbi:hypothetical protein [Pectobacterium versatile]|uniref:hypothetical protein n=1 Tax=Pectobacterium versatile TaxID=2488639 RepID=UPI000F646307|nr:hypothetical protein [Pectobacterium versatile]AZK60963.1 hypothetical protein EIP93_00875 [Pectobacterium versatile]UCP81537.1 hypothetical protein LGL95_21535 [Pectobacterium versatile]GKX40103.1 hypothetical protein SOASR014_38420 [Pectobacterium carotovorum subsp. carotovorum]GLX46309.1 hypothetical protein Pcaca01_39770 [Pectobacterium carotovorum subsp. carotovorum]
MRFIIMAPEYTESSGGVMVLHKLCHLLNSCGEKSYMHPMMDNYFKYQLKRLRHKITLRKTKYRTNLAFNTPVLSELTADDLENSIIIYPETVAGNPLRAKNIVRWFLHHPGYQSGNVNYNSGEIYFSFGAFGRDFKLWGSKTSNITLRVTHMLREHYNEDNPINKRHGTAYCLRKGKGREIVHDLSDSIFIDNKSHSEIAKIFKEVEYFISYDLYTIYTKYAIMCGCIPIVIPDDNLSFEQWLPLKEHRLGIAYGFDMINQAKSEKERALSVIDKSEIDSINNVYKFIVEVKAFFKKINL